MYLLLYNVYTYVFTAIGDMELMYLVIVLMCSVTYSGEKYICVIKASFVLLRALTVVLF